MSPDDDYTRVARRLATQMHVARAAARVSLQANDLYLGLARIEIATWEEAGGYRLSLCVHFDLEIELAAERRRVSEIMWHATDRRPLALDILPPDGVRAVVAFAEEVDWTNATPKANSDPDLSDITLQ